MGIATRRMGVLGGTFDPIHFGHLAAAEEAWQALDLQQVILVPNWQQPLKRPGAVAPAHRLRMAQLAVAGNPRLEVSDIELRRAGPSYTLDTLRALRVAWGGATEVFLLLGADAAAQFGAWRQPAEILTLCYLVVMSRSEAREPDWATLEAISPHARERVYLLTVPDLDISATDLRARLAAGRSIRYQTPDAVREHIAAHQLYSADGPPAPSDH